MQENSKVDDERAVQIRLHCLQKSLHNISKCLVSVYWKHIQISSDIITPTNHSHTQPRSIPNLARYFLRNVYMQNIRMLFCRI